MRTMSILYNSLGSTLAFAASLFLTELPAGAQSTPIPNASFEDPAVKPGIITTMGIPGWGTCCFNVVSGVANLPSSSFVPPTDGSQVGYVRMARISGGRTLPKTKSNAQGGV